MKRDFCFFLAVIGILLAGMSVTVSAQTQTCAPLWQVGMPITVGEVLSFNGHNWQAIQGGYTTITGWEPPNTPALWSDQGPCSGGSSGGSCSASSTAPSGLSASATTSSATTLSWSGVTPPASCSITSYTIFENGSSIGTTGGTSFTVSGLAASTTYSFTVDRKSTRLNSSHLKLSRMPSSA